MMCTRCKLGRARFCTLNQQNVQFQARPPTANGDAALKYGKETTEYAVAIFDYYGGK